ncbi:LysR substrate-binding domain-containing protein [Pseudomonas sp. 7P_10.2_Bac1]|uniref:LysR substrate-binding domain-containing protein n=1 Tax=Pseudomonas sp. 7P_10.2_Bac1 TaxID=2971614 RepID=UPI0021CA1039|nr:LysR substrate-binding domain-containing protein [Pseudomonas sp. 7P_10.2_Bac1]MCU1726016.1 LysR substrate-binding domain-containing protein [Pseudomonas sp. 7P_10.2_Bac1]
MGVREIEIFRVVMTTGSTSKAAGMLGISQPAVSQAIRKLESSAELQLFDRVRGRLIPTPEAQALMVDVDQFFVGFEMIEHRLKSLSHHGTDRLVVATHPALGYAFMPRALAAFHPAQRDLSVSLRILSSREVHQQVTSGLCDFGLMADEMPVAGLEHSHFMNAPGIIAMAPSHPLAARPMITPNDLSDVEFLALNPEDSSRRRLEQALQANGVKLKIRIETAYAHTLCEMAIHGLGVAFVNPLAAFDFIDRGLVIRPFSLDVRFNSLLLFRPGRPLGENARLLIRGLRIQLDKDLRALMNSMGQQA